MSIKWFIEWISNLSVNLEFSVSLVVNILLLLFIRVFSIYKRRNTVSYFSAFFLVLFTQIPRRFLNKKLLNNPKTSIRTRINSTPTPFIRSNLLLFRKHLCLRCVFLFANFLIALLTSKAPSSYFILRKLPHLVIPYELWYTA